MLKKSWEIAKKNFVVLSNTYWAIGFSYYSYYTFQFFFLPYKTFISILDCSLMYFILKYCNLLSFGWNINRIALQDMVCWLMSIQNCYFLSLNSYSSSLLVPRILLLSRRISISKQWRTMACPPADLPITRPRRLTSLPCFNANLVVQMGKLTNWRE